MGALGAFLKEGGESDYLALLVEHCQRSRELANYVESSLIIVMCVGGGRRVYVSRTRTINMPKSLESKW